MKRLFLMTGACLLIVIGGVGCSGTTEGMKADASKDTAAVEKGAVTAVDATKQAAENTKAATEKAASDAGAAAQRAGDRVVVGTQRAGAAVEKGTANAVAGTEKAVANAAAGSQKAAAEAGQAMKHTGKVLTITPKVKMALLRDDTLFPSDNPSLSKIDVDTGSDGQTVYLKGTVKSADLKKRAGQIATQTLKDEQTSYKVENDLKVVP